MGTDQRKLASGASLDRGARRSVFLLLGAALALSFLAVGVARLWPHFIDDGYIFLQYARNVSEGHGFVYQAGERVDGQSNSLWVLLIACAGKLGVDGVLAAKVMGVACGVATLAVTLLTVRAFLGTHQDGAEALAGGLGLLLVAAFPGFAFYASTGLGTALTVLLVTMGVCWHALDIRAGGPRRWRCYVPLALLGWTRPEAPLVLAIVWAHRTGLARGGVERRGEFVRGASAWIPWIILLVWRWVYFGSPLPNPFYAKPGTLLEHPAEAFAALGGSLAGFGEPFWVAVLLLTGALVLGPSRQIAVALLAPSLGYFAFALYTGGDWMPHGRFIQPVLPLLALAATLGVVRASGVVRQVGLVALLVAVAMQAHEAMRFWTDLDENSVYDHALRSQNNVAMGKWLARNAEPGTSILTDEIGAIGYYSGLRILDQWGLVDREVARVMREERFNPYTTPPDDPTRTRAQARIAGLLVARDPDFVTIDYRAPLPAGASPDPRGVLPITMAELFEAIGPRYRFRRSFPLMDEPPKSLLLYERTAGR